MGKLLNIDDIKPLIKESLIEMIKDNKDEFREMISEAIEEIAIANAVKGGRKKDYVSESRILKIVDNNLNRSISSTFVSKPDLCVKPANP